jgi:hypothetical protein
VLEYGDKVLKEIKSIISGKLARKSEKFDGIHNGETCYIFGDGPSVKWFDLSCFGDHPAICCNLFPFHKDFDKLDVRYCTMLEPWVFAPKLVQSKNDGIREFRGVVNEYRSIVKKNPDKQFFISASNFLSLTGENINFMFRELPKNRKNKTDELLRQFDLFGGSFHAALTLAYYLGFKKIYLVGFDGWTIQPARALHWYELGKGEFFEPTNFATEFLDVLKTEVDISAITYDGESRNVNAIRYEAYTGKPPVYKENFELLSEHRLNVLATYPEYKIRQDVRAVSL